MSRRLGALVSALAIVASACGAEATTDDPGAEGTSASTLAAVTTAAPTTSSVPATTTTTLDPVEEAWNAQIPFVGRGQGEFRTNAFIVPFSFDTGDARWIASDLNGKERFVGYIDVPDGADFELIVFVNVLPGLGSIDETVQAFADIHDDYPDAAMSEPMPVTLGGAEGVIFETQGLPIRDLEASPTLVTDAGGWFLGGHEGEILVVEVNGQIMIASWNGTDGAVPGMGVTVPDPAAYQAALESARALINTITWKNL